MATSNAPVPFSDDREVALAALRSITSERVAEALLDVLEAMRTADKDEEDNRGSRKAQANNRHPAALGAGARQGAGAAATNADPGADPGARAGEGELSAVPDSITPVVGWRAWKLHLWREDRQGPALLSLHFDEEWTPGEPITARCDDVPHRRHVPLSCNCPLEPAPATNCRCGLYAVRDFKHVEKYVSGAPELEGDEVLVVGRIALWGRVMEYEDGWRAEHGYPQAFYIARGTLGRPRRAFLASFGVPVLADDELRRYGWTPPVTRVASSGGGAAPSPLPDAPGLDPGFASVHVDDHLARELAVAGMGLPMATRFVNTARHSGARRLGQLLGLPRMELFRMRNIGHKTVEQFRAWRIANGLGDFPEDTPLDVADDEDDFGDDMEDDQDVAAAAPSPPTVPNNCNACGTPFLARGHGRALCDVCRPINRQLSGLRAAQKRATADGMSTAAYDELIATLEAQRPRPPDGGGGG